MPGIADQLDRFNAGFFRRHHKGLGRFDRDDVVSRAVENQGGRQGTVEQLEGRNRFKIFTLRRRGSLVNGRDIKIEEGVEKDEAIGATSGRMRWREEFLVYFSVVEQSADNRKMPARRTSASGNPRGVDA